VTRLVRAAGARAWAHRDTLTVLAGDGRALRFDGHSADLALAVFEHLAVPRTRDELLAHVASLTGAALPSPAIVDDLLAALTAVHAVASIADRPPPSAPAPRRVVLCVSGAVAAAHAPALVTRMLAAGWELRLAATRNALRFVARDALEAIAATPVEDSHWRRRDRTRAHHIELAEWAELVVVYPASATTLARIARGDCDEVVSATVIATRAPVVLCPSMNPAMYGAPSVQRNLGALRDDGMHLVVPAAGVEVAHAPRDRAPVLGPAPTPDDVFAVARAVLGQHTPALPHDRAGWNALYAASAPHSLPWHRDAPEDDLAAALDALARPDLRALDLGTGVGTVARYLAALGCAVVATDVAPAAIEHARARDRTGAVTFAVDDACASALTGPFDLVVDRGCLHCLPREDHTRWRDTLARVSAPGARLVLLVHDVSERGAAGTVGYDEAGLRALLAPLCDELRVSPSVMRGPGGVARKAWRCTARVAVTGALR
jgi:3-polyprenyl-4-hydroxybenzoate decarboxylase